MDAFRVHVIHSRKPVRSPVHNLSKCVSCRERVLLIAMIQHKAAAR